MANKVIITRFYGGFQINAYNGIFPVGECKTAGLNDIPYGLSRINNLPKDFYDSELDIEFDDSSHLPISENDKKNLVEKIQELQKEMNS